jgi:hypothetical protein
LFIQDELIIIFSRERVPLHWLGLNTFEKMANKATAKKKAAPATKKPAASATKAKPKPKKK